jgi:hypothetical protein
MMALKMLVIGFGRRKVKRGVAHTAPVKELAARSMVNKLSAKKIAADAYRSLREDWHAAIFTRGLVNLSTVFLAVLLLHFVLEFFFDNFFFIFKFREHSVVRVVCRRTRGAAADIPTILKANASFCCIWGGTQRRFEVRQRCCCTCTYAATAVASIVETVETFALICMDLCML